MWTPPNPLSTHSMMYYKENYKKTGEATPFGGEFNTRGFQPRFGNKNTSYAVGTSNGGIQGPAMSSISANLFNPNAGRLNQVQVFEFMNTASGSNGQQLPSGNFNVVPFGNGQPPPRTGPAVVVQEPGPSNFATNTFNTNNQENSAAKTNIDTTALLKKGNENIRIFTGTPEKIVKWHRLYRNYFCFYEVISPIVSIQEGTVRLQKIMLLRDKKGPILQVVHYVNDHIDIENFFVGQILRCVGRMVGPSVMHGLSIRQANPDEIGTLQRMCFISDHAISKLKKN